MAPNITSPAFQNRHVLSASLALALALSACGGGDDVPAPRVRALQAGGNYVGVSAVNETFTGPIPTLNGTTIQGNSADVDEITFTTAGTIVMNNGTTGGTITQINVLNLALGSNAISFANGSSGIVKIVGAAGSDAVDLSGTGSSFLAGHIDLSDGANSLTMEGKVYTGTFTSGASLSDTLLLVNGSDISGATVTGFDNLTLASNAAVVMTPTQFTQFSGTITAPGTERITFSVAGTMTAAAAIEQYQLANGTNDFTSVDADVTVTGGTGTDTFHFTANQILNRTNSVTGGGGNDVLTIGATATATIDLNSVPLTLSGVAIVTVTGSTGTATFTNLNGTGRTLNYVKGTGDITLNLGTGGQTLNLTSSGPSAATVLGSAAPDTIGLPPSDTGTVTLIETGSNMSNRTQIDTVANFNQAGSSTCFFKTGVAAGSVGSFIIGSADTSNYLSSIGSGLSIVLNNTGQAYLITIQTGSAAGTYLFQNTGSNTSQFDDTDFFVKLTGNIGTIASNNLIQ